MKKTAEPETETETERFTLKIPENITPQPGRGKDQMGRAAVPGTALNKE